MKYKILPALLLFCTLFSLAALEITQNGAPCARIAVAKDAPYVEQFAAKDLQHWIREISGAELPIVNEAGKEGGTTIFIGKTFAERLWQKEIAELNGSDGFAVRSVGSRIYLFGSVPRASAYAAAALLERNTDIIWARPDEKTGCVFSGNPNLRFTELSFLEKPAFTFHGWNVVAVRRDRPTGIWVLRNRGNWADQTSPAKAGNEFNFLNCEGGHIYWWMAHPDRYFKTNPEFFGFSKLTGKREPETLCLTNPELLEVAVGNLKKRIRAFKEKPDLFTIGFRDSWTMCQCEKCLAPIPLPGGGTLTRKSDDPQEDPLYFSTRYWLFVNQIVERLKQDFPETMFAGSGYFYAAEPPACELDPAVIVSCCPIGGVNGRYPLLDKRQSPVWKRRLEQWSKRFPGRLLFYEYYRSYASGFAEISGTSGIEQKIVHDLRDLKRLGGIGVNSELTPDSERKFSNHTMKSEWDANSVSAWILARLIWNPAENPRALRDYYLERTFREAAPQMKRFYDLLDEGFRKSDGKRPDFIHTVIQTGLEKKCFDALCEAEKTARHPNSLSMIRSLKKQWITARGRLGANTVPRMESEEKFMDFHATCYETSLIIDDFRLPGYFNWGKTTPAARRTEARLLTDGTMLYIRLTAENPSPELMEKSAPDLWPSGDHIELRFENRGKTFCFAVDGNGNRYDSLNSDRKWESGWKVLTARNNDGWTALLAIPLKALGVEPGNRNTFPSLLLIRRSHDGTRVQESTPKGIFPGQRQTPLTF